MSPQALFHGARMAVRLARECERDAGKYDQDWRNHCLSEAKRHRERAAFYLKRRKPAQPISPITTETHHVPAHA